MLPLFIALIVATVVIGGILYITISQKITMASLRKALINQIGKFLFAKVIKTYREGEYSVARIGLRDEYGEDQECAVRSKVGTALTVFRGRKLTC